MKPDIFASNTTETNPFPYTDNQIFLDVNPSSMEEEEYLHFPDPFLDDDDLFLSHFLSQQQHLFAGDGWEDHQTNNNPNKHNSDKPTAEGKKKCSRKIATNRTGKKDRHSKICTAQGPRDRRMRLSLQIARKFFDLQDMLGFDKASKTIDWLLSNSKSAIKELKDNLNPSYSYGSVSSGSSEVLSEVMDNNVGQQGQKRFSAPKEATFMGILKDKKSRPLRTVARESRDRARARARERTQGKLILKGLENSKPTSHSHSELQTEENSRFNFQGVNSELQEVPQFEERPADSASRIEEHKIFSISDFPDFPWDGKCPSLTHSFCSGNRQLQCPDPTLSCPYSIFMATPTLPHPKPYNFSDTTLLKLP